VTGTVLSTCIVRAYSSQKKIGSKEGNPRTKVFRLTKEGFHVERKQVAMDEDVTVHVAGVSC
jgi:hypothetical protein